MINKKKFHILVLRLYLTNFQQYLNEEENDY